jgi:hypothetical protein
MAPGSLQQLHRHRYRCLFLRKKILIRHRPLPQSLSSRLNYSQNNLSNNTLHETPSRHKQTVRKSLFRLETTRKASINGIYRVAVLLAPCRYSLLETFRIVS